MPRKPKRSNDAEKMGITKRRHVITGHFSRVERDYRPEQISLSSEPWSRPDVTEAPKEDKMAS